MAALRVLNDEGAELVRPRLGDVPLEVIAEFYAAHLEDLEQLESWCTTARRRLLGDIRAHGGRPIETEHGRLVIGIAGLLTLEKPAKPLRGAAAPDPIPDALLDLLLGNAELARDRDSRYRDCSVPPEALASMVAEIQRARSSGGAP